MTGGHIGYLTCWEQHERDGSWHAWVSQRIQPTAAPVGYRHHVGTVRAGTVRPLESPMRTGTCRVGVLGTDGKIRPWQLGPGRADCVA